MWNRFSRAARGSAHGRHSWRARSLVAVAAVAALVAGCSTEQPVAPNIEGPQRGLLGSTLGGLTNTLTSVTGLLRVVPLSQPVRRSVTVTRSAGGELYIPETGLRLTVPPAAITTDRLTITVTALPGRLVAYEFEPHGTTFARPIRFSQQLGLTSWLTSLLKPSLQGGYFEDASQLNTANGVSQVNETLDASVLGSTVQFDIRHFSGYLVSTGRSSKTRAAVEE